MSDSKEKLFSEFPPVTTEQWMNQIVKDLKGADFDKKLVWKTGEGFDIRPFYRAEDIEELKTTKSMPGLFPYVRGTKKDNNWFVRQDIEVDDIAEANAKALTLIKKGITSLGFEISRDDVSKENIAILLNGIDSEKIELNFSTCSLHSVRLIRILVDYFKEKNYDLTKIHGSVNLDFIGRILRKGVVRNEWIEQMVVAVNAAAELRHFKVVGVNACLFNNSGAFITQELGYALAWGNELLQRMIYAGINPTLAAKKIKFNFGIGSNYFLEIAKFRAARWLWAEIVKAYKPTCKYDCPNEGPDNECRCAGKMNIFAQTSSFNQTVFDPYVNLLRTQTEAMSATIAGVNSLLVTPFDESFKTPDEFSERIARNQQLLLKEECHFDKVVDASGGSYYIESLTQSIAQQAWKIFLELEERGFYESVKSGDVQATINASAEKRFKAVSQRREILLGTNQYPNFTEKSNGGVAKGELANTCCPSTATTLNSKRLAEEFETLRLTTENSGKEVKAFMLTIGNLAMRLARSQFSSNFLACAGYKVIDNLGFETVAEGVEAARKAGADIIVLCSSDDEYATYAPKAQELIEAPLNPPTGGKKELLIIAGAPACMDELKEKGITNFINIKSNVLETLKEFNSLIIK